MDSDRMMTKMNTKEFPFSIEPKLQIALEKRLLPKLKKEDVWIIITGRTGSGKSNIEAYISKWFSCYTGRPFGINNFYYDADQVRQRAQSKFNDIIDWDEGGMGGLSIQWFNKSQIYLIQLSMTCRIRHHVILICIPDFTRLKYDLIDRANCMIRTYLKKGRHGRYMFYSRKRMLKLWHGWKSKKKLKWGKYRSFGGSFPEVFPKLFTEKELQEYEDRKNDMIANIGHIKDDNAINGIKQELKEFKYKIGILKFPIRTQQEFANKINITPRMIQKWRSDFEKGSKMPTL